MARGPVHEAFATPTTEPAATKPIPKKPPEAIQELPPDQKPAGDVVWIGGYWAWDDDRQDFLWVSGTWRAVPPGKQWVAGYWRESQQQWQWVPGFWTNATAESQQEVTYLPAPPTPPQVSPPGPPPTTESFYVPGVWVWNSNAYVWQAGYWGQVQPGYVWVAAHYQWTPGGYVYVAGYWDLAVSRRGVLYAPIVVDYRVAAVGFVYTPAYAVSDTIIVDSLFVRPCYCHYYFGDYYGPEYRTLGFESCIVYSRAHYDSIFVYSSWEHRAEPGWATFQLDVCLARHAGRAPCPPRTLVQQTTVVNNVNVTNVTNNYYAKAAAPPLVTPNQLATSRGAPMVPVSPAARVTAQQQATFTQQVAKQRSRTEVASSGQPPSRPVTSALSLPPRPPGMAVNPISSQNRQLSTTPGFASNGISAPTNYPGNHTPIASSNPNTGNKIPGQLKSNTSPFGSGGFVPHGPTGPGQHANTNQGNGQHPQAPSLFTHRPEPGGQRQKPASPGDRQGPPPGP